MTRRRIVRPDVIAEASKAEIDRMTAEALSVAGDRAGPAEAAQPMAADRRVGVGRSHVKRPATISARANKETIDTYELGSARLARQLVEKPTDQERFDRLWAYIPRSGVDPALRDRLRPQMIEAVMRIEFVSRDADARMASRILEFGTFCCSRFGSFDWETDLNEERLTLFADIALAELNPRSRNTYLSTLRQVHRGGPSKGTGKKHPVLEPFLEKEWERLWTTAKTAPGSLCLDALLAMSLSGGAGLAADELPWARSSDIEVCTNGVTIRVAKQQSGEFREVPVFGKYAEVLQEAIQDRPTGYLVRPALLKRSEASHSLKKAMSNHAVVWSRWDSRRARNTWISQLLASRVPVTAIIAAAGLSSSSTLLADLGSRLPPPSKQELRSLLAAPDTLL